MNREKLHTPLSITVFFKDEKVFEKVFMEYPITIGRSVKCDVPLPKFDFLSRQHCSVSVSDTGVISIEDLQSSNGLYFHGKRVKKVVIKDDLNIEIGDIRISFGLRSQDSEKTVIDTNVNSSDIKESLVSDNIPLIPVPPSLSEKKSTKTNDNIARNQKEKQNKRIEEKPLLPKDHIKKNYSRNNSLEEAHQSHSREGAQSIPIKPDVYLKQLRPQQRVLEAYVTWKDQIYGLHQYYPGEDVVIGRGEEINLEVPILKRPLKIAQFSGPDTYINIPQALRFELQNEEKHYSFEEAPNAPSVQKRHGLNLLKLGSTDMVSVALTDDVSIHFKYVPAPRQLSKNISLFQDEGLKKTTIISGVIHFALLLFILMTEPKIKAPKIDNVPERYARILVKPPTPPPPLPEPPKPEPPPPEKVVEKRVPPKPQPQKQPKQQKVVKLQKSKVLSKVNKYPVEVAKPMKPAERPIVANVQAVGALAALSAVSSKMPPSNVPVAININKNAGGQTALNTGGVIGTLKSSTGKLVAGGFASVKTKGLGYGTGTGYGVQGIKGTAGGRAVAGTVVGAPSLVRLSKEDGLSRQQVMDVVKRHMTEIQRCYERSLIDSPNLAGRVEYEWEITPNGGVTWAKVKKSEVSGGDSLNGCVTGVFKKMKFPVATNGQNTIPNIGFPFGRL